MHLHLASPLLKCNSFITALGPDKNCLAKFEQKRQPSGRSNSARKMGFQFCHKGRNNSKASFDFRNCMALDSCASTCDGGIRLTNVTLNCKLCN